MNEPRRLRGILGLSALWGVALSALATAAVAVSVGTGFLPEGIMGPAQFVAVAVRGLLVGAGTGALFGWLLSNRERGRLLSGLSRKRVALWSFLAAGSVSALVTLAVGGTALPLVVIAAGTIGAGIGGSAFGLGLLSIARRKPEQLIEATDEPHQLPRA